MNLAAMPDGRARQYSQTVAYAHRRTGDLKNTPPVQHVAARLPEGACASRSTLAQLRPTLASQRNSSGSVRIDRPIVNPDKSAAAPAADADHRQADYFLRLLTHDCRRIEDKIAQYHKAIAVAERRSAIDHAQRIRRMLRVEEQKRQTLDGLIDRLQRRFPLAASVESPVAFGSTATSETTVRSFGTTIAAAHAKAAKGTRAAGGGPAALQFRRGRGTGGRP